MSDFGKELDSVFDEYHLASQSPGLRKEAKAKLSALLRRVEVEALKKLPVYYDEPKTKIAIDKCLLELEAEL